MNSSSHRPMLAFLHTGNVHVDPFTRTVRELDPTVPLRHLVREDLLAQALADGRVTESTRAETRAEVKRLVEQGARVVLCTCSTLGDAAESADQLGARVLRVDRPMAERVVALGRPTLVVAGTPTAMASAVELLRKAGVMEATLRELLCAAAWERFQQGDHAGYVSAIAERVQEHVRPGEVVMLAQASMTPAAALIRRSGIEVLTSPELGVRRALELLPSST